MALPVHLQIKFSTQSRATVVCGEARVSPAAPNPFLPPSVFRGLAVAWLGVRIFFLSSSTVTGVPEPENSSLSVHREILDAVSPFLPHPHALFRGSNCCVSGLLSCPPQMKAAPPRVPSPCLCFVLGHVSKSACRVTKWCAVRSR